MSEEELPVPHWLKDAAERSPGGFPVHVVEFEEVNINGHKIEYSTHDNKMVFHFWKDSGPFPMSFRSRIWKSFMMHFNLHGKDELMQITFEEELHSWCVVIKNVAAIVPPSDQTIVQALTEIVS